MTPMEYSILFFGGLLGTILGAIIDRYCRYRSEKQEIYKPLKTPSLPPCAQELSVKRLLEINRRGSEIETRLQAIRELREEVETYLPLRSRGKMLKMLDTLEKRLHKEMHQYEKLFNVHHYIGQT